MNNDADTESGDYLEVVISGDNVLRSSGSSTQRLRIEKLCKEFEAFISSMSRIIDSAKNAGSGMSLTEVSVSAAIAGGGKLTLLGSGVDAKAQSAITFKFVLVDKST